MTSEIVSFNFVCPKIILREYFVYENLPDEIKANYHIHLCRNRKWQTSQSLSWRLEFQSTLIPRPLIGAVEKVQDSTVSMHCAASTPSNSQEQRNRWQGYLYIQVICSSLCLSLLDDSGWGADTYSDMEQHDCPQAAAFLSQRNMHNLLYWPHIHGHISIITNRVHITYRVHLFPLLCRYWYQAFSCLWLSCR